MIEISDSKLIAELRQKVAKAEEAAERYRRALRALEGESLPANPPAQFVPRTTQTAAERIRAIYQEYPDGVDARFVYERLKGEDGEEKIPLKYVSSFLGREAAHGKLKILQPAAGGNPAAYQWVKSGINGTENSPENGAAIHARSRPHRS